MIMVLQVSTTIAGCFVSVHTSLVKVKQAVVNMTRNTDWIILSFPCKNRLLI